MHKLVLVILDGLRHDTARACLGHLEGLVAAGEAGVRRITCELPAMSRPLYETILTGRAPADHGIVSNGIARRSDGCNVFSRVREAGGSTAAAAYHWVSELYRSTPFDRHRDRLVLDGEGCLQHGAFYWDDRYPDSHLFSDAEWLIRMRDPDFLLVHSMNIDDAGHAHGGASTAYRNAARAAGDNLARHLPGWRASGRKVIVMSDHGMGDDGNHAGPVPEETEVPFYTLGFALDPERPLRQTEIAGLACRIMGIDSGAIPAFDDPLALEA